MLHLLILYLSRSTSRICANQETRLHLKVLFCLCPSGINIFSQWGLFSAQNYPQNCTCQIGVNTDGTIGDLKTYSGEKSNKCNTMHWAVTCQIGVNTLWCNWAFGLFCTACNSTISPLPSHTACISDSTAIFLSYTRILTKMVVNLCRQWYDGILLSGGLILLEHSPKQAHSKSPFLRKMIRQNDSWYLLRWWWCST